MLKTRVITGAVLSVIIATVLIFSHIPWVLNIAVAALCVQAIYELYNAVGLKGKKVLYLISYLVAIIISFFELPGYSYITATLFAAAILLFVYLFVNIKTKTRVKPTVSVLMAIMIVFFFKTMSYIRKLNSGVFLLGGAVLISVLTDIAAYFVGRGCGKHKLVPIISPKKTIEGSVGGTLYGTAILVLIAVILQYTNVLQINIGTMVAYAVLASVVGQFGDLAMSSVKRIVGIKDYGNLLPGHGGVLDRFDSMLFVFPFTYLFCLITGSMFVTL